MTWKTALLAAGLTAAALTGAAAEAPPSPAPEAASEPKLALVLSGGGARGAAHVGVLKVLEELRVAPDLIVGTSMGSIIGGLYAAGWSPEEMEELLASMDWNAVFSDEVPRPDQTFRRKQDDRPVLIQARIRFKGWRPYLPSGILGGQSLQLLMDALQARSALGRSLDELNIPFRAVAADLETGRPVVISEASLSTAMRASMSIPAAFAPMRVDGRLLVDGGAVANLPIGIAKELGATAVIAVDISSPIDPSQTWDFLSVSQQMTSLLTAGYRDRDVALLDGDDVLLEPDLGDIAFYDFNRTTEAVKLGEKDARGRAGDLVRYAVDDDRFSAFLDRQRRRPREPVTVDRVRIENGSRLGDAVVRRALDIAPGDAFEFGELARRVLELHGLRAFGIIDFRFEEVDGERELVVTTPPPEAGRSSVQLGLGFSDDFDGNTSYTIAARHQLLPVNRLGGEWENAFQLGTVNVFSSELYQPLEPGMRWFAAPAVEFRRELVDLWSDGMPFVQYEIESAEARLAAGRVVGRWGELRATAFTADYRALPRIGDPAFPSDEERRGGLRLGFRVDTVDSVAFPTRGTELSAGYERSSEALGAENETDLAFLRVSHSFSAGRNTFTPYLEYGENLEPTQDYINLFKLGGLGRLSGLGDAELVGEKVALARLLAYRRLTGFRLAGINVRVYVGLSLEAGNVYGLDQAITGSSLETGWSAFLGADSPLGPLFLGYGRTDDRDRFYLVVGDRF
ncbi:MAG TPA: patatin-like phospholipase family protein [Methylomirabilota bacterium]|nr:patatin-like phospholipase family protein [Methylomirabilota bacterium]